MATLLNFVIFEKHTRLFIGIASNCDVIVVVYDWLYLVTFRTFEILMTE